MKKLLMFLLGIIFTINGYCQDIITLTNGDELHVKVLEVTPTVIRYQITDSAGSKISTLEKYLISRIKYQNGSTDVFSDGGILHKESQTYSGGGLQGSYLNMAERGKSDAKKYYANYRKCVRGVVFGTLYGYIVGGLATACACGSTPPKDKNLNFPNNELMQNPTYYAAYKSEAYAIKKRKTWGAFATAAGAEVVAGAILAVVMINALQSLTLNWNPS